jgi:Leucine-rich repeat (LRR) protein
LGRNALSSLPPELWQLTHLQYLDLSSNRLSSLPPEIGQLAELQRLWLNYNQLQHLPTEIGNLNNLTTPCNGCGLFVDNNPLISPPPEVVAQGTNAMLNYLRNQAWYHLQRLIIGAASGVGVVAMVLLGLRFRYHRLRPKKKRA